MSRPPLAAPRHDTMSVAPGTTDAPVPPVPEGE